MASGLWLANQRAVPDDKQQRFELCETLRPEFGAPLALDVAQDVDHLPERGVSAFGKTDLPRAALTRNVGPDDIAKTLKAPEQLVDGLFAHAGAFSERAGADLIRT